MWIRSQDKELLKNVNSIEIIKFDGEKYTTIQGDGWHLGFYSTKEKALKVLDQIQYNIEPFEHEPTMVFQMCWLRYKDSRCFRSL